MAFGVSESLKDKVIAVISALIPEAKIYLFGSRARGTASERSDIDLALDAGEKLDYKDVGEINSVMEVLSTPYTIQVVDFNGISAEMREAIIRDKIIWKA